MWKKGTPDFITRPWILSILPAVFIILIIPFNHKRYALNIENAEKLNKNVFIWYEDITNNGISEKILFYESDSLVSVAIFSDTGVINQWNFRGRLGFMIKDKLFLAGNFHYIDSKSIFFFSLSNDSLLMHALGSPYNTVPILKDRFVSHIGRGISGHDPYLLWAEPEDLDGDGLNELVFGITTGFSLYPRAVFAYYFEKDSIIESPPISYNIVRLYQGDITGDGVRETVLHGYRSSNINPDEVKYHDHSNWLMVLDSNLDFLFPPIEYDKPFLEVTPLFLDLNEGSALYVIASKTDRSTLVQQYKSDGKVVDSVVYDFAAYDAYITQGSNGKSQISLLAKEGISVIGHDLAIVKTTEFKDPNVIYSADLTGDGTEEIIVPCFQTNHLYVYRSGYRNPVSAPIDLEESRNYQFSTKKIPGRHPLISLQTGQTHYLISYSKNDNYYLNWLYYFLIYFGLLSFATVIRKTQRAQFQRRHNAEKRINDLQLSLVHNQLNSHFSLNALNSVIHSVMFNQSEEACNNLRRFAFLYKSMLLSAGQVFRMLSEEIEFCNNYLQLEKSRFENRFNFSIVVDPGVNMETNVPIMVVQTYAENAVKHGLSQIRNSGQLKINVSQNDKRLLISVIDNGIGRRKAAQTISESTGKGLETMNEFYRHLKIFYNYDCTAELEDLYDISENAMGTRVAVTIMMSHAEN